MPSSIPIDVAVIGAGTAGLTAFSELRRLGLSAVLIDHGPLGTTCARVGCMPSKAALHAGHQWANLRALRQEAAAPTGSATPNDLWSHARQTRDLLADNTAKRTRELARDRLLMGTARFTGPDTVDVGGRSIHARAFIVATGSGPVVPPSLAALGDRLLTTDNLFDLETLPGSVGILGLGAIGLEMGLALARLGVRVVAGDMKALPAGIVDPEIGAHAIERFGNEITMWLGRPVEAVPRQQAIELRSGDAMAEVDLVLVALGRRPDIEGLDLRLADVPLDARGQPVLHARSLRAGPSGVFLAGDASAIRPLMHEAVDEGLIAARGEHLAHLLAWAIQRGETAESLLMMPYYHPSIEEMVQSALKDASRQLKASA